MKSDEGDEVKLVPETQFEQDVVLETQVIPETQCEHDHGTQSEIAFRDDSIAPTTAQLLAATNPAIQSLHKPGPGLAEMDLTLIRPKSSGQNLNTGFVFTKAQQPILNFSRAKQPDRVYSSSEATVQSSTHNIGEQRPKNVCS
jgi:hypothetical protein